MFERVESPITAKNLAAINANIGRVQFGKVLTERDHLKLAERLRQFPQVCLRAYETSTNPARDLDFLRYYPGLKRLDVGLRGLQSIEGIKHVAGSLEGFYFDSTEKKFSLEFLADLRKLKTLALEGHSAGIEAVSTLENMEDLTFRSITLPGLELLTPLKKLWSLDIKLGGTKNLAALSRLKSLKYLELWQVRGLSDISVISELTSLQHLFLESLKNVKAFPSFRRLKQLRRVKIQNMKGISDLAPLLEAKHLEDFVVRLARHLTPESFLPLVKHPSLKAIGFGLGSTKKNQAVAAMFPHLQDTVSYPFIYQ